MPHRQLATVLRRQWMGIVAIALTVVAGVVPASFAQDSGGLDRGKSEQRPTHDELSGGVRSKAQERPVVHVAVPIGRVSVGPEFVEGEPVYVRRTKIIAGMTIVEISTTPFMPEPPGVDELIGRSDEQPASW